MARVLTIEEQHREDTALEAKLRDRARSLDELAEDHRLARTPLATRCRDLASTLRDRADHLVRVWN